MFLKILYFTLIIGCVAAENYDWGERGQNDTLLTTKAVKMYYNYENGFSHFKRKLFAFPFDNHVRKIFLG